MATIDINFTELKRELNNCSFEDFEELLFDFGLEVDSYNRETDEVKIEVTAERVDLLSKQGLLRALKPYLGISSSKTYTSKKSNFVLNIDDSVKDYRPYSVCAVVKNLNLTSDNLKEIINAQEKLHQTLGRKRTIAAIGIYPFDKITFPISFIAKKPEDIKFIPLGETRELNAKEILKETEAGKEYASLLESKDKYPIFIDKNNKILSMPPIINSEITGKVTENTKEVFIECSGFDQYRLNQILNIICCLFADIGGEIYSVEINYGKSYLKKSETTPNFNEEKRLVSITHINSLLGVNFNIDEISKLLEKMDYKCKKYGKEKIEVCVPIYRTDILHEVDIIDDVSRAHGYNNIILRLPKVFTVGSTLKDTKAKEEIIDLMAQLGFIEISPLSLSNKKESFTNFNLEYKKELAIELGYTKDKQLDIVSSSYLPKLFKILTNNKHHSFPQNLFVCNYVVLPDKNAENRAEQKLYLSAITANSKVSYTEMASVVLSLCNLLGLQLELKETEKPFYIKGRAAEIVIGNKIIGHLGEVHPEVIKNFDYSMPVVLFEMDLSNL